MNEVYDSLNILDLDSNDEKVLQNILGIYSHKSPTTDLMIAHFLGIDHAGHCFDVDDPMLEKKIEDVDKAIDKILTQMPNDTVAIIFGDHGMIDSGNHGGDT